MPTLTGIDMGSSSGAFSAETTCIQRRKTGLLLEQGNAMLQRIETASGRWRRIGRLFRVDFMSTHVACPSSARFDVDQEFMSVPT
jgi:hypothetical protein